MQVIYILGDQQKVPGPGRFQVGQRPMSGIGLDIQGQHLPTPGIVEGMDTIRIRGESFRGSHILEALF